MSDLSLATDISPPSVETAKGRQRDKEIAECCQITAQALLRRILAVHIRPIAYFNDYRGLFKLTTALLRHVSTVQSGLASAGCEDLGHTWAYQARLSRFYLLK